MTDNAATDPMELMVMYAFGVGLSKLRDASRPFAPGDNRGGSRGGGGTRLMRCYGEHRLR